MHSWLVVGNDLVRLPFHLESLLCLSANDGEELLVGVRVHSSREGDDCRDELSVDEDVDRVDLRVSDWLLMKGPVSSSSRRFRQCLKGYYVLSLFIT
jgi:hypothetical protein